MDSLTSIFEYRNILVQVYYSTRAGSEFFSSPAGVQWSKSSCLREIDLALQSSFTSHRVREVDTTEVSYVFRPPFKGVFVASKLLRNNDTLYSMSELSLGVF